MGKRFKSDSPTMEEIRRVKKPNRKTVYILLDSELKGKVEEANEKVESLARRAKKGSTSLSDTTQKQLQEAQKELDELLIEVDEMTVPFLAQDIGRKNYDALVEDPAPTDKQKTEYKEGGGVGVLAYNPETFPPALIAACYIEPKITLEFAQEICNDWGEGDIEALFFNAISACKERTSIPLSKSESVMTTNSPSLSDTVPNEESDIPNS